MTTQELIDTIVDGAQDRKARNLCIVDLSRIDTAPCSAFVLATGGSPQQVEAITDRIGEFCRKNGEKPVAVAGLNNAQWVAMDYGTVMVHVFLPAEREFYDLEHLWDDAELQYIADLD